jgi:hypothetical protein
LKIDDKKMSKIMDILKGQIKFDKDLKNHLYFFNEPEYDSKYMQSDKKQKQKMLEELLITIKQRLPEKEFNGKTLN